MNKLVQSYIKKYGSTFKAILELHRMVKYLKQQNSLLQRSIDVLLIDEGICNEGELHHHHDGCPSCDSHLVPTGDDRHKIITDDGRVPAGHTFDEIHNQPENRAFDAKYSRS